MSDLNAQNIFAIVVEESERWEEFSYVRAHDILKKLPVIFKGNSISQHQVDSGGSVPSSTQTEP